MAFEKIEKELESLGWQKQPSRRDFTKGKHRVNAIDLGFKLPVGYTMEDLKKLLPQPGDPPKP